MTKQLENIVGLVMAKQRREHAREHAKQCDTARDDFDFPLKM